MGDIDPVGAIGLLDTLVGVAALLGLRRLDKRVGRIVRRLGIVEKVTGITPPMGTPINVSTRAATEPGTR